MRRTYLIRGTDEKGADEFREPCKWCHKPEATFVNRCGPFCDAVCYGKWMMTRIPWFEHHVRDSLERIAADVFARTFSTVQYSYPVERLGRRIRAWSRRYRVRRQQRYKARELF